MYRLLLALILMAPLGAGAVVNAVTRHYQVSHLDIESKDKKLSLRRNYHSSRQQGGWFGRSMCTVFESQIVERKGQPHFRYCGAGATIPLDGTFGLSLSERNGGMLRVKGRHYTYLFDKNRNLVRILFRDKIAYQINHAENSKLIRGQGFALKLKFQNGLVERVTSESATLKYRYDSRGQLQTVSQNGKSLYAYKWASGKLVEHRSFRGIAKKVAYNQRGQVESVKSKDCVETLQNQRQSGETYLLVMRKCKGESAKSKRIVVSGRDTRFNYKIRETGSVESAEMTVHGGLLASKKINGHNYAYDYDQNGRIKRLQIDDILLSIKDRDQFQAKRILVSTIKRPDKEIATLKMTWLRNQLTSYRLQDREWTFKPTKYGQILTSPQYRLSLLKRGRQVFVKGMWRGEQLKPFRTDRGPASLNFHQRRIADEIIEQDRFRKALEAL
jgi:hypothetical protein